MEIILMLATIISPVVLALIELIKRSVNLPKRFLPLISVAVGLVVGALAGLSATGLFELSKSREGNTFDRRENK